MNRKPTLALLLGAALLAGACGREKRDDSRDTATAAESTVAQPAEFAVTSVMIGKRIGADQRVAEPTFRFTPKDTVYAAVSTEGKADSARIAAHWIYQTGKVIDSTSRTIHPSGPTNVDFHLTNPKGLAVGTYAVKILADGDSVDTRTFRVAKEQQGGT